MEDLSELLHRLCKGDENAWHRLLNAFREKKLTTKEQEEVRIYIKKMSETNPHALYIQGLLYDVGLGVKQDFETAFLLLREAASFSDAAAIYETGRRYLQGLGVEKNNTNAFMWLSEAANSPYYYPAAMHYLGLIYEKGLGVPIDSEKAKEWFEKAAEKGYRD